MFHRCDPPAPRCNAGLWTLHPRHSTGGPSTARATAGSRGAAPGAVSARAPRLGVDVPSCPARRRRQLAAAPELPRLGAHRLPDPGRPTDVGGAGTALPARRGRRPGLRRRRGGGVRRPGRQRAARALAHLQGAPRPQARVARGAAGHRDRRTAGARRRGRGARGPRGRRRARQRGGLRADGGRADRRGDLRPGLLRADRPAHPDAADPQRRRRRLSPARPASGW